QSFPLPAHLRIIMEVGSARPMPCPNRSPMTPTTNNRVLEVALLVETDDSWGRSVITGVADFAGNFGAWNLLMDPRDHNQSWSLPDRWRGDGIIARIRTPLELEQVLAAGLPAVNVDDSLPPQPGMGQVITDDAQRAELALNHFLERGFAHFGYFAPPSQDYSRNGEQAFAAATAAAGFECQIYRPGYRSGRRLGRDEQYRRVARWLVALPKPTAVLAVDARRGRHLAEICSLERIRVPDEVAILAGDTDELICNLSNPPLSSIVLASQRIGHDAAAMLHGMMQGVAAPQDPVLIAPIGVESRQSTDVLAIDDPMIVQALRFIRTHAYRGIVVEDVRRVGGLPAEEIRRLRLERGRELLMGSDLSVEAVAAACGYAGATQFGVAFRKCFGSTPLAFRRKLTRS
ncbi:MAG TPA: substrate-binding domain-containing protein, partial [Lacipirellulaceae bacterium]|nr:substrate-binding domain-containing protein [Lacipirellulaceae bacterium]